MVETTPARRLLIRGLAFGCGALLALVIIGAGFFFLLRQSPSTRVPVAVVSATPGPTRIFRTAEPEFVETPTLLPVATPTLLPVATPEPITLTPPPPTDAPIPTITALNSTSVPSPGITPVVATPTGVSVPVNTRLRVGNGPDAHAPHFAPGQFVLDGQLNEWGSGGIPLTLPNFGADAWQGPQDASGTGWLGWDENGLLFAAFVRDDAHVQTRTGWEMFRGDSVELWIDADLQGDFATAAGNADDWQFGFSPGDFQLLAPEGVIYIPVRDAGLNRQIQVSAQPVSDGYTIEARIPWGILRVRPQPGLALGYAIDTSDNDVPGTAQQQTQVTGDPNFQFNVPTTFGNLILE